MHTIIPAASPKAAALLVFLAASFAAVAAPRCPDPDAGFFADLGVTEIRPAEMPGLCLLRLENGALLYVDSGGEFILEGELYQLSDAGLENRTERVRRTDRKKLLAAQSIDDMIVFEAPEERGVVYVFTDVDCYYCRRFHQGIKRMHRLGITVRYLAYPRSGLGQESYSKLVTAWCSPDPQAVLTGLKKGKEFPPRNCSDNPVAEHYELGRLLNISGTPALLTPDGDLFTGHREPDELAELLRLSS